MKNLKFYIATLLFFTALSCMGQAVNLLLPANDFRFKVTIPKEINLNLPSSEDFSPRFFIKRNDTLICVGRSIYTPGEKSVTYVGYDAAGKIGYREGDSLISLMINVQTGKIYGIQFTYKNNKNRYSLNDSTEVTGVYCTTWERYIPAFNLCKSLRRLPINIPYGLHPSILTTEGVVLSNNGAYSVIELEKMNADSPTGHTIQILDSYRHITYTYSLISFDLLDFPLESLNATDSICHGDVITIPTFSQKDSLTREAINNAPYQLITPGEYLYQTTNIKNGCSTTDTISILAKQHCESYEGPALMNPLYGGQIVFPEAETIKIFNSNMEKITEFEAPAIWRGTNASGTILPVGIYFIQHGSEKQESITLIY